MAFALTSGAQPREMATQFEETNQRKKARKKAMTFKLTSQSFRDGDYLDQKHILSKEFGFGCAGGNQSPQLSWSGIPEGTKSFAVTCFDPDAPPGSGFWHWVVINIPANVTSLDLGAGDPKVGKLPAGALQTR